MAGTTNSDVAGKCHPKMKQNCEMVKLERVWFVSDAFACAQSVCQEGENENATNAGKWMPASECSVEKRVVIQPTTFVAKLYTNGTISWIENKRLIVRHAWTIYEQLQPFYVFFVNYFQVLVRESSAAWACYSHNCINIDSSWTKNGGWRTACSTPNEIIMVQ